MKPGKIRVAKLYNIPPPFTVKAKIPDHLLMPLGERLHSLNLPLLDVEAFDLIAQGRVVVVFDLGPSRREINIVSPETTVQDLAHEISKREPFQ